MSRENRFLGNIQCRLIGVLWGSASTPQPPQNPSTTRIDTEKTQSNLDGRVIGWHMFIIIWFLCFSHVFLFRFFLLLLILCRLRATWIEILNEYLNSIQSFFVYFPFIWFKSLKFLFYFLFFGFILIRQDSFIQHRQESNNKKCIFPSTYDYRNSYNAL